MTISDRLSGRADRASRPDRRSLLAGGLGSAVGAGLVTTVAAPASADPSFTDAVLHRLPADDHIWGLQQKLARLCPAATGSRGHAAFLDLLAGELAGAGIAPQRHEQKLDYWEPGRFALSVGGNAIPLTGRQPYSSPTGPNGVEGPLVHLGQAPRMLPGGPAGPKLDFATAAGKIAVIDIAAFGDTFAMLYEAMRVYPEADAKAIPPNQMSPIYTGVTAPDLSAARAAGVLGVVFVWNGFSDENVMYQMQSFVARPGSLPAVWVGTSTGTRLRALAAAGSVARLTLEASIHPDTPAPNLWGLLPGASEELVIINSHTDGTNATEENGAIAVVSLARALAKLPSRRRSYAFLMTSGHFSHGLLGGAGGWQKAHPELMARAVACVTVEHLGAMEWTDNAELHYHATGHPCWGRAYTRAPALADLAFDAARSLDVRRVVATYPKRVYPGEGGPFDRNGLPTLSYIALPDYLVAEYPDRGGIGRLSRPRMLAEIRMFARWIERIDAMDVKDFAPRAAT